MAKPHFGFTRYGLPVHLRVQDHLKAPPGASWITRFNSWLALKITRAVGTMWCAYAFALFDCLALPTAINGGLYGIVQWVASFFLQLVLLSIIMVGQDVQAKASDARAAKTFEDAEVILDRLDTNTQGGIQEVLAAITALGGQPPAKDLLLEWRHIMTVTTVRGFDATHANIGSLPKGQAAGYITGTPDIEWTAEDWAAHIRAVRIDQSPVNTSFDETADVLDYEGSAATISDVAPWAKAALANYRSAARPGQRSPAIYMSQSNVTAVANALIAGKVTGVGLWVADWTNNQAAATAEVANGNGPYPVIGVQYQNAGLYDEDIFSVPWLTRVSTAAPAPPVKAQVPPGQWNDPSVWVWAEAAVTGTGEDGKLHSFVLDVATGAWARVS